MRLPSDGHARARTQIRCTCMAGVISSVLAQLTAACSGVWRVALLQFAAASSASATPADGASSAAARAAAGQAGARGAARWPRARASESSATAAATSAPRQKFHTVTRSPGPRARASR